MYLKSVFLIACATLAVPIAFPENGSSGMPEGARAVLSNRLETLDRDLSALNNDGFIPDDEFVNWTVDSAPALRSLAATMEKYYAGEGTAMSADAVKPAADRAGRLRLDSLELASHYAFPTGLVPDSSIESAVAMQLSRSVSGVKVRKVAMRGTEWTIDRDEHGSIVSRHRYGYVLYQIPGEQFSRCSSFPWREIFDGKDYVKINGAVSFEATRWQTPRSTRGGLEETGMSEVFNSFLAGVTARDANAIANCFSPDAVVIDVGRKISGRVAIRAWAQGEIVDEGLRYEVLSGQKTSVGYTFIVAISSPKFSFRAKYVLTVDGGLISRAVLDYA